VSDSFLPRALCEALSQDLTRLREENRLLPAGIGRGQGKQLQTSIRGDSIAWLEDQGETPAQVDFLARMEILRAELNQFFFLGLKRLESHFAWYPPGSAYAKHLDQHVGTKARQITFVLYLNGEWKKNDGGELRLYEPGSGAKGESKTPEKILTEIEPVMGRFVIFRSELFPHSVQASFADRRSLTGWFRNDALI
jgi:SM-20-related protein